LGGGFGIVGEEEAGCDGGGKRKVVETNEL